MEKPSKLPETVHEKLRRQRNYQIKLIESFRRQINEAKRILKKHEEAGDEESRAKKELLIQQLEEKKRLAVATRRRIIGRLKRLTRRNVIQNQRKRKGIKEHFFFASDDKYWSRKRVPDSMFRIFQELHCARRYWTVPKQEKKYGNTDLNDIPLDHTVVDPSRVSAHFLKHFQIPQVHLFPDDSDEVGEQLIAQDNVDRLKNFYDLHVCPLTDFGDNEKNPNFSFLVVEDWNDKLDGEIINPRTNPSTKRKGPAIFHDAYSLLRKTEHMNKSYDKEKNQLSKALKVVNALHAKLGAIQASDSQEDRARKRRAARQSLKRKPKDVFKGVRNEDKVEAREALKATELTDSRGQVNPGAGQARLVKVRDHVQTRKKAVKRITDITDEDRDQLKEVIQTSERILGQYGYFFKKIHDKDKFTRPFMHGGSEISMRDASSNLSFFKLRPFRVYAAKLQKILGAMEDYWREGKPKEHRQEALKGHVVAQIFKVQKAFEEMLMEISIKTGFTKKQLVQKAREIWKAVEQNKVEGHEAVFDDLKDVVSEIGEYLKDNPEGLNQETLRLAFKEYLKSIDFPVILAELD